MLLALLVAVGALEGSNLGSCNGVAMLKWIVVIVLVVLVTGLMRPGFARRLRLGQLPGDLSFRFRNKAYHFPFTTTVLFSLVAWLLFRVL